MAYGPVNVPGATGAELAAVRQLAQNANNNANAAGKTADAAKTTADAALEAANAAAETADSAQKAADTAQETADGAKNTANSADEKSTQALEAANNAANSASNAEEAAVKAQEAADAALAAITGITSTIEATPSQSGTLTYTGSAQSPTWNSYDSEKLTIGGTTSGTNAGSYNATFTPKEGYKWSDGTTDTRTVAWTIGKASVAVPSQSGSLTYTGSELTPSWSNYDSNKLTIGGTTKGTNAGSYNATFTPKSNYQWSDGTTAAKTVTWSIGKAAGSLSLNPTSLKLSTSALTGEIIVTREGDGAITAKSSNTSIASVSVSGNIVTVTAEGAGDATITVSVAAGTNHTAPANKTASVNVEMASANLADNTPANIQAAAQSGQAPNLWSVGDNMPIALNGTVGALSLSGTYYAFILGFNHNSSVEGGNSIHFQFGKNASGTDIAFVDSNYNSTGSSAGFRMNTSNTNSGGWKNSYMRGTICPAFLSAMPTEWQNVIAACTKYSDNTGGGSDTASYVTSTSDKIWLLAEFEVFGTRTGANSAEQNYQKQYDYYANGNSKIKYKHNDTATACLWWLRSVRATYTSAFRIVDTSGSGNYYSASASIGFAPGFKVA